MIVISKIRKVWVHFCISIKIIFSYFSIVYVYNIRSQYILIMEEKMRKTLGKCISNANIKHYKTFDIHNSTSLSFR